MNGVDDVPRVVLRIEIGRRHSKSSLDPGVFSDIEQILQPELERNRWIVVLFLSIEWPESVK